jgi:hypothetical protein
VEGCLYQVLVLLALVVALIVVVLSWPVSAWLAGVLAGLWLLQRRENPWTKSARKTLQPVLWALCILGVLQIVYNASLPEKHTATISAIEGYIADFATGLPKWSKLSWWQVCIVLAVIMMVNALKPEAKLVSKFLKGRKLVSRTAATLAVLASFSFFGTEIFGPQVSATHTRIRARLAVLEKEALAAQTRRVVLNAVRKTTEELGEPQRAHLLATFRGIGAISAQAHAARAVAPMLADTHWHAVTAASDGAGILDPISKVAHSVSNQKQTISFSTVRTQEEKLALRRAANAEAEKGLKEIFSKSVGAATDWIRDIAFDYIGTLIDLETNELLQQTRRYFETVGDAYLDKLKEPLMDKAATKVRAIWGKLGESEAATDEALKVVIQTKRAAANEAIALATTAKNEAAMISGRSGEEVISAAAKIEAHAQRASELASIANDLLPETMLHAKAPAIAAGTGLVIADSSLILKDLKAARTAAQSARTAAIAAKEAVAMARAARQTAQTAEAAKNALKMVKAIPK